MTLTIEQRHEPANALALAPPGGCLVLGRVDERRRRRAGRCP